MYFVIPRHAQGLGFFVGLMQPTKLWAFLESFGNGKMTN
jgi:hypothetical protein